MTLVELQFFLLTTYFFYILAIFVFHSRFKKLYFLFIILFVLCALVLRLSVPLSANADFEVYNSYLFYNYKFSWSRVLAEPFLPFLFKLIKNYVNSESPIFTLYMINFVSSCIFYIWLACRPDLKPWVKITLFSFTYILFSYTVIRNTPAYLLFGVLIYYLLHHKKVYVSYLGFLSHVSVLPATAATFLGFSKPTYKQLLLIFLASGIFVAIMSFSAFDHITNHLDDYTNEGYKKKFGVSTFHLVYFIIFICINALLFKIDRKIIYNNFYISIFIVYLVLYLLSPVMSYRFSFYNILYLTLYPYYSNTKLDVWMNIGFAILMIFLFEYGFYSNHDRLKLIG